MLFLWVLPLVTWERRPTPTSFWVVVETNEVSQTGETSEYLQGWTIWRKGWLSQQTIQARDIGSPGPRHAEPIRGPEGSSGRWHRLHRAAQGPAMCWGRVGMGWGSRRPREIPPFSSSQSSSRCSFLGPWAGRMMADFQTMMPEWTPPCGGLVCF